jgi:hypothetical protein
MTERCKLACPLRALQPSFLALAGGRMRRPQQRRDHEPARPSTEERFEGLPHPIVERALDVA